MSKTAYYLGIDPGRSKTGLALVDGAGQIVALHIAMTESIDQELQAFVAADKLCGIVMGDGTNNKRIGDAVRRVFPKAPLALVG